MKLKIYLLHYLATLVFCIQQISTAPSAAIKKSQPLPGPLDSADQAAIAFLEKEAAREKRGSSGSGDILNHIKSSIAQGIKSKISQIAKSSAGASAYFSKSSSAHKPEYEHGYYDPHVGHYPHYPPPPTHYYPSHGHGHGHSHDDKPFDLWTIKKSVLYTLLQAVKAIKGGVIAIKGQLIKGGGHLLTAKGKLIRGGGEALTHLGKNIALSAFHWAPTAHQEEAHDHHEAEEPPSAGYGYSAPSGGGHDVPPSAYGPPTGGAYYHNSVYDGKTSQQPHDGLIILRKIPKNLRHPADTDGDHTNDDQQQHEDPHGPEHGHHHVPQHHHHAEYAHHEQDQPDVQESQKTPAFRPLSDGIVPKMKNLVNSVFLSSGGYPSPPNPPSPYFSRPHIQKPQLYDNDVSHSQYNTHYNSKITGQKPVQPQQANIGSLVNYLEYIRRQKTGKHSEGPKSNGDKVFVTPAPQTGAKVTTAPKTEVKQNVPNVPKEGSKVTQEQLKHETILLEQQLQQLASLQGLQQQLQYYNPYAAQVAQQGPAQSSQVLVHPEGHLQLQGPQGQTEILLQPSPLPPNTLNYELYNSQGEPQENLANIDLASILTQYQLVPDIPPSQSPQQNQPQEIQIVPQQTPQNNQYLEDPMQEAESSQVNTFLIHVPDEDTSEGRSLRHTTNTRPKSKRHSRPLSPPTPKSRKLSQLQQVQLMQQQLYHRQPNTPGNDRKQTKRSPSTIDVIRSISFELGPSGLIKTHH